MWLERETSEGVVVIWPGWAALLPTSVGCPANWACESDTRAASTRTNQPTMNYNKTLHAIGYETIYINL